MQEKENQPKKIAILGTASTSVHDAPFNDPAWKIWDMSSNFQYGRKFDLWYEIHDYDTLKAAGAHPSYLEFLKKHGPAIIAGHPSEHWPDATLFPLAEIVARFGDYFTCTAAYMIAHAMLLHEQDIANGGPGVGEIGLWGIDMAVEGEHSHQRPCCEYYLGMARGMGIKVYVAPQSPIIRSNAMYGFDNPKLAREITEQFHEVSREIEKVELQKRIAHEQLLELKAVQGHIKRQIDRWQL